MRFVVTKKICIKHFLGIKMPIVFDFEQASSQVLFQKNRILIHAGKQTQICDAFYTRKIRLDYCFDENCKSAAAAAAASSAAAAAANDAASKVDQSQDMDVNYYDATG